MEALREIVKESRGCVEQERCDLRKASSLRKKSQGRELVLYLSGIGSIAAAIQAFPSPAMADAENVGGQAEKKDYTEDGTVDFNGRPCRRSEGGRWVACSFIFVYGVFERLAYFGVAPNLVLYFTNKLHQTTVEASNNVNNWSGTAMMTPILGAYIADSYLGRYWTFNIFSAIYLLGMVLLSLSVTLPSLSPPPPCGSLNGEDCKTGGFHATVFFLALYVIALGSGGTKAAITTLGADQFDVHCPKERFQKLSFFNWWTFALFYGNLFSTTVLVYIQDYVGFSVGYMIPTAALVFSMLIFFLGTPSYRHKPVSSSPITTIGRVLVAAVRKWKVPLPDDPNELYELEREHYSKQGNCRANHSTLLVFFDKAAVRTANSNSPWLLCSVTEVEETKKIIKLLPIFIATLVPSLMTAQILTVFVKQGSTMDRMMGSHFQIPSGSLSTFFTLGTLISVSLYDKCFVPLIKKRTQNPRGITMLQRMGVGQALQVVIMIITAMVERWRLSVVKSHDLVHQTTTTTVPLSVFALLPQFALMGMADMLVSIGKMEFFYDQAPEGMKSVGASVVYTSLGLGNFISSFLLSMVEKVTRKEGKDGWIEKNLNASHLDYYYGFLAGLCAINLIAFLVISNLYVYNRHERPGCTTPYPASGLAGADPAGPDRPRATGEFSRACRAQHAE
ncbi:Peptide transporter PTR3-A [Platanthera zijinensis]|uniref:Peptide transporter PTR3-A n=1 Tax=Platanthera zijinensis TaxID=2320716 RepID=A0AAP0BYU8_9ASPA